MQNATPAPYRRPGFWRRLRTGNLSEGQLAALLLTPALLTLALVMLYPVVTVVWQSLHFERLNQPFRGTPFIGLDNFRRLVGLEELRWGGVYQWGWRLAGLLLLLPIGLAARRRRIGRLTGTVLAAAVVGVFGGVMGLHPGPDGRWTDPRFWNSFDITLLVIAVSVGGSFLVGLPLALLANVRSRLRWLGRVALLLPWAMPRVLAGLTFAWLFQSQYGVVNDVLRHLGVGSPPLWLARVAPAIAAVNITLVWKTSSFVGLILLAGLQSIDESLYEAALVDGASAWQRFWSITLPLLRPSIAVALIFRTLTAIQTFDIPFAMTRGGPGRSLETLGVYIYNTTVALNIGYAAAVSVVLFLLSLAITIFYLRWIYTE